MNLTVFFVGLVLTAVSRAVQPVKTWWRTLSQRRALAFLIIMAVTATFIGSGGGGLQAVSGLPGGARIARLIVIMLLFFLSAGVIVNNISRFAKAGAPMHWMLGYSVLCMFSATYSISPVISLWKGFEVFTLLLTSVALSTKMRTMADIKSTLSILSLLLFFFVVTLYVGVALFPGEAFSKLELSTAIVVRGLGPKMNANTATQVSALLAMMAFPIALYTKNMKSKPIWVVFGIGLGAMLLGHSRTSVFAFSFAVIAVLFFSGRKLITMLVVTVGAVSVLLLEAVLEYIYRGQNEAVFTSLTGRTLFWERAFVYIKQSPIVGHGFYAAQRELMGTSTVDSTYVDILIGLGVVGLVIFTIPVVLAGLKLLKTRPRESDADESKIIWMQLLSIYILLVVRSLTAPSFQVLHPSLVFFSIFLVALYAYARLRDASPASARNDEMTESDEYAKPESNQRLLAAKDKLKTVHSKNTG